MRLICLLAFALSARSVTAIDLNGTWQGTDKCRGFAGGTGLPYPTYPATLEIVQTDTRTASSSITVRETYAVGGNTACVLLDGMVTQDSDDATKGAIALIQPGTTDTLTTNNGLGTARVATRPKRGAGKLKATLVATFVGGMKTCKLSYTRVNTSVESIPLACP